jgi:effector-binding domain-containing protein
MKWLLGLVLGVALLLGGLFLFGTFMLPNGLEVTRTVTVERPRAAVYAMAGDLRIAKEWSPYYARDPGADYTFTGEAGPGQSMRWVSDVRAIGSGRMSIVDAVENRQIQGILEIDRRATLNSRLDLNRAAAGTEVSWTMSARCSEGAINVPCRYMNLVLRGTVLRDMDSGLARLKTLVEQLPNVDFEGLNPGFDTIQPQSFIYSVVVTSADNQAEVTRAETLAVSQVRQFMASYNLTEAGPLVRVVTEFDPETARMSFRVGYPFSGPTPLSVIGVQIGQTPSGEAMHVMVEGSRAQVRAAYAQMDAYLQAHRIAVRENGLPWEVVHEQNGAEGPVRIEVFMPLQ